MRSVCIVGSMENEEKSFTRKESLKEIESEDSVIIDSDNYIWVYIYGGWICQMDLAWPKSPKLPVWLITSEGVK